MKHDANTLWSGSIHLVIHDQHTHTLDIPDQEGLNTSHVKIEYKIRGDCPLKTIIERMKSAEKNTKGTCYKIELMCGDASVRFDCYGSWMHNASARVLNSTVCWMLDELNERI